MISNYDIRSKARDTLEHSLFGSTWITLVIITVIFGVIVGLPGSIGELISGRNIALIASVGVIFFVLSVLIEGPMEYGLTRIMLNVVRKEKKADIKDLFIGYNEALTESVLLGLLRTVFIALWSLLLFIPGVIKAYAYSMAFYIQQDSEDKDWRSCLDRSQTMMKGYKGKLFLLDLSFIGWYILGALCFGIGILWVSVYHATARTHFYEELKAAQEGSTAQDGIGTNEDPADPLRSEDNGNNVFSELDDNK